MEKLALVRISLERADFLLGLAESVVGDDEDPWLQVHLMALLGAGIGALREAVEQIDRAVRPQP